MREGMHATDGFSNTRTQRKNICSILRFWSLALHSDIFISIFNSNTCGYILFPNLTSFVSEHTADDELGKQTSTSCCEISSHAFIGLGCKRAYLYLCFWVCEWVYTLQKCVFMMADIQISNFCSKPNSQRAFPYLSVFVFPQRPLLTLLPKASAAVPIC